MEIDEILRLLDMEFNDIEMKEIKPLTQIVESEDEVIITLDLPCVEKKDISIKSTEDTLIINAACSSKIKMLGLNAKYYRKSIRLPTKVDPRYGKAYFNNGVLQIILPKKLEGKEIEVE